MPSKKIHTSIPVSQAIQFTRQHQRDARGATV